MKNAFSTPARNAFIPLRREFYCRIIAPVGAVLVLEGEKERKKRKPHFWCVPASVFTSGRVRVNEFAHTSIFYRVDILGYFSIDRLVGLTLHLAFCSIPHFLRPTNWHKHSTVTDREQMAAPFSLNWQPQCRVSCGLGFSLPPARLKILGLILSDGQDDKVTFLFADRGSCRLCTFHLAKRLVSVLRSCVLGETAAVQAEDSG